MDDCGCSVPEFIIRRIAHADGLELRAQVLRPGGPSVASTAAQYGDSDAIHLGAFCNGLLAATVSFTPYDESGLRVPDCYQLRGVATRDDFRNRGFGSALVLTGIRECQTRGVKRIWCNGRSAARRFYERLGFRAVDCEFITATGPHFCFLRDL